MIRSRYVSKFQFGALLNVSSCNSSPLWQELRSCFPIFSAFSSFHINNGESAIFWENKLVDGMALKYSLPDLYDLAVDQKFTVARLFSKFRRNDLNIFKPFDPNSPVAHKIFHQLLNFNAIFESLVLNPENDSISWSVSSNKIYSVKPCYALLNDGGLKALHARDIWKCKVPLKIKVFTWLVIHDKILSKENLAKKGWMGSIGCVFCGCAVESSKHIFFQCIVTKEVWTFFLQNSYGLDNMNIGQIFTLFSGAKFNLCMRFWNMLVLAIIWCL